MIQRIFQASLTLALVTGLGNAAVAGPSVQRAPVFQTPPSATPAAPTPSPVPS